MKRPEFIICIIFLLACDRAGSRHQFGMHTGAQKLHVVIGAVPMMAVDDETVLSDWSPTFERFLNDIVGPQFSPPVSFSLIPLTVESAFEHVENGLVDFVFANPSLCACLEAEFSVAVVATLNTKVGHGVSSHFGGLIFTRANNSDVNSIVDLRGKVIEASSILSMGSGQTQWQEMRKVGLDLLVDPAQVIFVGHEQSKIVEDVFEGKADVGLVRSGYIEHLEHLNLTRKEYFKFINVQKSSLAGTSYPAELSTQLYPQWPLVSTVNAIEGGYSSWEPPHSYSSVTLMNVVLGIYDHVNDRKCIRESDLYSAVSCPAGHFKLSKDEVENRCAVLNLPCPEEYNCLCSPCQRAEEIEVYLAQEAFECRASPSTLFGSPTKCYKMEACGVTQQGSPLLLHVVDNKKRSSINITYNLWHPSHKLGVDAIEGEGLVQAPKLDVQVRDCMPCESQKGGYCYMWFETVDVGWHFIQVMADGVQIPNSPFIIQVTTKACEAGSRRVANEQGICICEGGSIEFGNKCVSIIILAASASLTITTLFVVLLAIHANKKIAAADQFRFIDQSELIITEPLRVFAAEYRGTMVAVKRVLPQRDKRARRGSIKIPSLFPSSPDRCASSPGPGPDGREGLSAFGRRESTSTEGDDSSNGGASPIGMSSTPSLPSWMSNGEMSQKSTKSSLSIGQLDTSWRSIKSKFNLLSKDVFEGFEHEMRLLSRLRHPCITTLMGAVVNGEEPLMVMELMDRGSLHDLLHNSTLMLEDELLFPLLRDVIQVSDFGMSHRQSLKAYGIRGSPYWMAPEILLGGPLTPSADVFAFGVTVFECLSRKNPYDGEEASKVLCEVADLTRIEAKRPKLLDPSRCSPVLLKMMHECWSTLPANRPSFESLGRQMRKLEDEGLFSCISVSAERHRSTSRKVHSTLAGIFPSRVMQALLEGRPVEPESREVVTIFFSDIAEFTNMSSAIGPEKTTKMLNRLYTRFDALAAEHRIFKVETIGDAYIAVTNLAEDQPEDHGVRMARFALGAVDAAQETLIDPENPAAGTVRIRVGLHSGPVVASAVGTQCLKYTLFGDSVNVASRMESSSLPNRVHCSMATANILRSQDRRVRLEERGEIEVKGKGRLRTYWLVGFDP